MTGPILGVAVGLLLFSTVGTGRMGRMEPKGNEAYRSQRKQAGRNQLLAKPTRSEFLGNAQAWVSDVYCRARS
jgi:hypothetical protein